MIGGKSEAAHDCKQNLQTRALLRRSSYDACVVTTAATCERPCLTAISIFLLQAVSSLW